MKKKSVETIHNIIKSNFEINSKDNILLKQEPKLKESTSYIINYYQKSEIEDPNNSILVKYIYEKKYYLLLTFLSSCLQGYGVPKLRFEYSNAYSPFTHFDDDFLYI